MSRERRKMKRTRLHLVCLVLLLAALLCLALRARPAGLLPSQQQAERWAGESGQPFTQLTALLPTSAALDTEKVYAFRSKAMESLQNADAETYQAADSERWLCDAWSCVSAGKLTGAHGSSEAAVVAVGGSFFDFHPLALRAGSYLRQEDLMRDRIVLDEALAWSLYGSNDLTGLTVQLDGTDYVVAGVIARETDRFTKKVSDGKPLCFVCYDTWAAAREGTVITCYELVCPEPMKHFTETLMKEAFPLGDGTWLQNTGRFSPKSSWKLLRSFGTRGMQTAPVVFPYWENAAIAAENRCAALLLAALVLLLLPAAAAVYDAVCGVLLLRRRLREALPRWREAAAERRDGLSERLARRRERRNGRE